MGSYPKLYTFTACGSPELFCPETIIGEGYSFDADFWQLGVFLFETSSGRNPFAATHVLELYRSIQMGSLGFTPQLVDDLQYDTALLDCCWRLLQPNPVNRLVRRVHGLAQLKQLPFFADVDWDLLQKGLVAPPFKNMAE